MYKMASIIFLICSGFTLMALQGKTISNEIHQKSKNSVYQSILDCQNHFKVGSFQKCSFKLLKRDKLVRNTEIFVSGGMLGHDHGLPTSPKVIWSEEDQGYQIKGLKFSMPGKWILNFRVNASKVSDKDIISMAITVN